jgi:hypothetical protein
VCFGAYLFIGKGIKLFILSPRFGRSPVIIGASTKSKRRERIILSFFFLTFVFCVLYFIYDASTDKKRMVDSVHSGVFGAVLNERGKKMRTIEQITEARAIQARRENKELALNVAAGLVLFVAVWLMMALVF